MAHHRRKAEVIRASEEKLRIRAKKDVRFPETRKRDGEEDIKASGGTCVLKQ